ncbi:BZ3500_MvSof-1268-A1-R1_Chr9g10888 [Microbotryum saponariae]|uniref:BZ3500_MvSof-1268-A1-R1_Chr9g10888 protein n=1 Tax=Microbotryum saponariae TaxID=289078 RepID=A0A2X0MFA6_9BASI|nr:BZ3501_MvSof-1269-A2-R1_Chr9g10636 [Microbotryum saponariae]SDA00866.1 BZ3500_MvSof-1268-A1-R1_Chr9g10888 [Microbotryum saponariae]
MLAAQLLAMLAVSMPALALSGLDQRSLQRDASAHLALARARAAKRSTATASDLAKRAFDGAYAAIGLTRRDFADHSVLSKRLQPRIRCRLGREKSYTYFSGLHAHRAHLPSLQATPKPKPTLCARQLRNKLDYDPKTANVKCNQVCEVTCNDGYTAQRSDRATACIKNVDKCRNKTCAQDSNGVSSCNDGKCSLECTTRGYSLSKAGTACIALGSDANNCSAEGNKCKASYDGRFAATCENGECSLDCPSGFKAGMNKRKQSTCVRG